MKINIRYANSKDEIYLSALKSGRILIDYQISDTSGKIRLDHPKDLKFLINALESLDSKINGGN